MRANRGAVIIEGLSQAAFVRRLGIEIETVDVDRAVLSLAFDDEKVTVQDIIHGGAIASLIDTAAVVAAWSTVDFEGDQAHGATVSLTVNYLSSARAQGISAEAKVQRRGSSIAFLEVTVTGCEDGRVIATGLVTYRLAGARTTF
ncbi:MAG: PaaI family thioesterase [Actinobacteria bacterium]|nr:PaaI family thioesterase [Actinomycetota bacterium]